MLTGGTGAVVAFVVGVAFARSAFSLLMLAAVGTLLACAYYFMASPDELLRATVNANLLGWLAGTVLAARLRALEWLDRLDARAATSRS